MAVATFRPGYSFDMRGGGVTDHSFATPGINNLAILPNNSYEVTIENETVIIQGSNLKPMRSKQGYYRLLYQEKLYVIHISEIREIDRTDNDAVSDTSEDFDALKKEKGSPYSSDYESDDDTPPINQHNYHHAKPSAYIQSYNVKLTKGWVRVGGNNVIPSAARPGFYDVMYNGVQHTVSAVYVQPAVGQKAQQKYGTQPTLQQQQYIGHPNSPQSAMIPTNPQQPQTSPQTYLPRSVHKPEPQNPIQGTQNNYQNSGIPPRNPNTVYQSTQNRPLVSGMVGQPQPPQQLRSPQSSPYMKDPAENPYNRVPYFPKPGVDPSQSYAREMTNRISPSMQNRSPGMQNRSPGMQNGSPGMQNGSPGMAIHTLPPQRQLPPRPALQMSTEGYKNPSPGTFPQYKPPVQPMGAPPSSPLLKQQQQQQQQRQQQQQQQQLQQQQLQQQILLREQHTVNYQAPGSPKLEEVRHGSLVTGAPAGLLGAKHSSRVKTDSYTVSPSKNEPFVETEDHAMPKTKDVRVFVGGRWITVPSSSIIPSKKKAGTYIVRIDGKSVRLDLTHIIPYTDDDEHGKGEPRSVKYHVFVNGTYHTIDSNQIVKHPEKHLFYLVTYNGHTETIHQNFIIPLTPSGQGAGTPNFPSHYKVMITPQGVTVPLDNVQADHTMSHMFVVLHEGMMYQVRTEALFPIFENEGSSTEESDKEIPKNEQKKSTLTSPTLSTSQKKKSPARARYFHRNIRTPIIGKPRLLSTISTDMPDSNLGNILEDNISNIKIPSRPKGKFPSKGEEDIPEECDTSRKPLETILSRDTDVYNVKIKGETVEVSGSKISTSTKRPGYFKVFYDDKWIYVKTKHVVLKKETTSSVPTETTPSVKSNENRSPFRSPVAWDKKLRVNTRKNDKPRWRQTNSRLGCAITTRSTRSLVINSSQSPNMDWKSAAQCSPEMVACETPGEFTDMIIDDEAHPPPPPESVAEDTYSVSGISDTPPSVSVACVPRAEQLCTRGNPGIPILQDSRTLSAPDAKANMDWVKSLRQTVKIK